MTRGWQKDDPPDLELADAFGVKPIVGRLRDLVVSAPRPFTIALSGSWGAGKTTVVQSLLHQLEPTAVPSCAIDLWTEEPKHLRRTLIIAIGAAVRSGTTSAEARRAVAQQLDSAVRLARTTVLPPTAKFNLSRLRALVAANRRRALLGAVFVIALIVDVKALVPELLPVVATVLGAPSPSLW